MTIPTVLESRVIYREQRFHAAFPSIGRFADDTLILGFRRARDAKWLLPEDKREGFDPLARMDHINSRSHVMLLGLDEYGKPLPDTSDLLPCDPEASDQDPSLLVLPEDRLFIASFSYYPVPAEIDAHVQARSETTELDVGCRYMNWGCHASLREPQPGKWRHHHSYLRPDADYGHEIGVASRQPMVGAARGQAVLWDGQILLPVYWGVDDGAAVFSSTDYGRRWRHHSLIAHDPAKRISYQEPALCPSGDGGLVCFMRTANADGRLSRCISEDGVHWSAPQLHELVGHPFHALPLADGRVFLSYGYREPPYGVRARLLPRATADPDASDEIIVRDAGLCPDIGYPWAVQLADGRILVVYYWTDAQGIRGIESTWLQL